VETDTARTVEFLDLIGSTTTNDGSKLKFIKCVKGTAN
jgi:hypothetical protein